MEKYISRILPRIVRRPADWPASDSIATLTSTLSDLILSRKEAYFYLDMKSQTFRQVTLSEVMKEVKCFALIFPS